MSWAAALLPALLLLAGEPLTPMGKKLVPPELRPGSDREAAAAAAGVFVETLQEGQAGPLSEMGADPFLFDGRSISGRKAIRDEWKAVFAEHGKGLERAGKPTLETLDYKQAVERFGKPPEKFKSLPLTRCYFAAVTFPHRPGLLLILCQGKKQGEGFLVNAVTD